MPKAPARHVAGKRRTPQPPKPPADPHVDAALRYAKQVTAGGIPACTWVVKACQRHIDDIERAKGDWLYRFDKEKAERACRFIELLPHVKGKWAKNHERLKLEPWQCFIVCSLFGWVRKADGLRRFRLCYIEVNRKNGKSVLAAAIGLYMLAADGETGAEVYSGATSEKQAWEVFRPAMLMAKQTPGLLSRFGIQVNASNINILGNSSRFEPIIGKPGDGASPSCSITDEYHEHQTSEQLDTMITGMGAREQPLAFVITTAGSNIAGPCYDLRDQLKNVLNGVSENEEFFGAIWTVDEADKWDDPAVLAKANPNMGVSVFEDFLRAAQEDAKRSTRNRARFLTKHLGLWLNSSAGFFDMAAWDACEDKTLKIENFEGCRAWLGLDLASKLDIAALEILIQRDDGSFVTFGKHYLPEATIEKPENEHYRDFMERGFIIQTDGNSTDYYRIVDDVLDVCKLLAVETIAYDPWNSGMFITTLQNNSLPVIEYGQNVQNYSEPMKQLGAYIVDGKINHPGDPCMKWMMANVTAQMDRKDNVYPRKEREDKKIDGPVALISAIGVSMNGEGAGEVPNIVIF